MYEFLDALHTHTHTHTHTPTDPAVYRAVPELRVIESVQLRATPLFVKELLQVSSEKRPSIGVKEA